MYSLVYGLVCSLVYGLICKVLYVQSCVWSGTYSLRVQCYIYSLVYGLVCTVLYIVLQSSQTVCTPKENLKFIIVNVCATTF